MRRENAKTKANQSSDSAQILFARVSGAYTVVEFLSLAEFLFSLALAALRLCGREAVALLRLCEREAVPFTEKRLSNNAYRYGTQGVKHTG